MNRKCLHCGRPVKGRSDKKYCDDACRNSYNNQHGRAANNLIRSINRILSRNRKILAELNPYGRSRTTRKMLEVKGFDFHYFTSIYETRKGHRYYFCYEQGYLFLEDYHIALVVREEYVSKYKGLPVSRNTSREN